MCGINGILELSDGAAAEEAIGADLARMNQAIAHRGPDGEGRYVARGIGLGHRRLAIIDLSDAGHQPMQNEDGSLQLVFNGEIYNYLELMPELVAAGHRFRSRSDSEVILHAYEQWGPACVERFNGMWAFAIWDTRQQTLFLSRDRLGVKPLFHRTVGGRLYFSSEPAGILAVTPAPRANLSRLHDYLAYGYRLNTGESSFEDVLELRPGHSALVRPGQPMVATRYWTLPGPAERSPGEPGQRARDLKALLEDAVRLRFRSDVPVALLQSGGLDSSAICVTVDAEMAAGRLGGLHEVTAFTAVHPGHAVDESALARAVVSTCPGIRGVEIIPDDELLAARLPEFVAAMQEPVFSPTSYAHWCLMRAIRAQGIKVVINGQGADEALAGYGRYIVGQRLLDLLGGQPGRAWNEARDMHRLMGMGWGGLAAQTAKALLGWNSAAWTRAHLSEGGASVLRPEFRQAHGHRLPEGPRADGDSRLRHQMRDQLLTYGFNQILHYEDQSSMHQSIEIRSPFIDYRLMEFAYRQPDDLLFSDGITKRLLREAFATRLPASVANNHKKLGFATPFDRWVQQPSFQAFVRDLVASDSFRSRGIWDAEKLARRMTDPQATARGFPTWRFLIAELWMRHWGIGHA